MDTLTIRISDSVRAKLGVDDADAARAIRLAAAFSLCQRGQLSTSQAAELANVTYAEFLRSAAQAEVCLFPQTLGELTEEVANGFTLGGQRLADHK